MKSVHLTLVAALATTTLVALGCGGASGGGGAGPAGGGTAVSPQTLCDALDLSMIERDLGPPTGDPKTYNDQDREASCQVLVDTDEGVDRVIVNVYKPDAFDGATGSALLGQSYGAHRVSPLEGIGDEAVATEDGSSIYFRVGEEVFSVKAPTADAAEQIARDVVETV